MASEKKPRPNYSFRGNRRRTYFKTRKVMSKDGFVVIGRTWIEFSRVFGPRYRYEATQ